MRALLLLYVQFGVQNPNLYRAMFNQRLAEPLQLVQDNNIQPGHETFAALDAIKDEAYECLVEPLVILERDQRLRAKAHEAPGLAIAALAHGLVGEFIDEGLRLEISADDSWTESCRQMMKEVTDMLLFGIVAENGNSRS